MKKLIIGHSLLVLLWTNCVFAGAGKWSSVPVFNQAPLEVKLGTYSDDMNSDLLTMVLWNDGSMNRLDAVRVPSPYNGTNVTSTAIENTNILFSLGDICRMGNNIVVPYIKNFNVEVAVFTMNNWSNMTIPETIGNDFDSADCAVSQEGIFVSGHDKDDSEIELFKFNPNTSGFSVFGKFGGGGTPATDIAGPFDGGVRDTLVMQRDGPFSMSLYQGADGVIRTAQFDSSVAPLNITHRDIEQEPVPAGFTYVKESWGARLQGSFVFGYNANSRAKTVQISDFDPLDPPIFDLGAINNVGSQFSFQGGAYLENLDGNGDASENNVLWDDYYSFDSDIFDLDLDGNYPLIGVGGPVATCRRKLNAYSSDIYVAGPKVGSPGTDFHVKELESLNTVFADGFESGDISAWITCP